MCDIPTSIKNSILEKIESEPTNAIYYYKLASNLEFGETIALNNSEKVYSKDELLVEAIKRDNTNSEFYYELAQFCKFEKQQYTEINNQNNNEILISISDDIKMGEIDFYLKSIYLINSKDQKKENDDDDINKYNRTISKYYISLADSILNGVNGKSSNNKLNNDNSKSLTLKLNNNDDAGDDDDNIQYKKKYLILKAIQYCPEKTNKYLHFLSNSTFIKNKNKPIKLISTNKFIKLKDYKDLSSSSSMTSTSNLIFISIFIILISINIYYLYFKK